jgi:hypothetical protein
MPVAFLKFLNDFKASFFDLNRKHQAKVALQSIRQTGTVAAYTQAFNMHACALEWSESTLMSLYQQGLKEKVQLAILMSNVAFNRLPAMQEMALRAGNTLEAIRSGHPNPIPSGTSSLAPDPNMMDLLVFQDNSGNQLGQLTDAKRESRARLCLFFRCGQEGHVSHGCRQGRKRTAGSHPTLLTARISEVQAEINHACATASGSSGFSNPDATHLSKNGGTQV